MGRFGGTQVGLQLYLKFRREHPHERILAFDTDFSKFVSSNIATLPTGGYFAVWLALARCAQVSALCAGGGAGRP